MPEPIVGQRRSCRCGASIGIGPDVPMPKADERVREWMRRHAKGCAEMREEITKQGGTYLAR